MKADTTKIAQAIKVIAQEIDVSPDEVLQCMDDLFTNEESNRIEDDLENMKED